MLYLIAYDIADPKRLQRIARRLEKSALRCQKSVFLFRSTQAELEALLDELAPMMKLTEDIVQAWKLSPDQPQMGLVRGTPLELYPSGAVLSSRQPLFVCSVDSVSTHAKDQSP